MKKLLKALGELGQRAAEVRVLGCYQAGSRCVEDLRFTTAVNHTARPWSQFLKDYRRACVLKSRDDRELAAAVGLWSGGRMKIERDHAGDSEWRAHGLTLGSPIALMIQ